MDSNKKRTAMAKMYMRAEVWSMVGQTVLFGPYCIAFLSPSDLLPTMAKN